MTLTYNSQTQALSVPGNRVQTPVPCEVELIRRTGRKDVQAFGELYDRFSGPLYSLVLHMLNDCHDAEDVLQKVFFKIWNKAGAYDESRSKLFTWLVSIARNEAIAHLRGRQRRPLVFVESFDETTQDEIVGSAQPVEGFGQDDAIEIRKVVNTLPGEQRRAIELAFFRGLTYLEIARQLGEPLGTIKARIRRGMLSLRDNLEKRQSKNGVCLV